MAMAKGPQASGLREAGPWLPCEDRRLPYYRDGSCSLPLLLSMMSSNNRIDLKISLWWLWRSFLEDLVCGKGTQSQSARKKEATRRHRAHFFWIGLLGPKPIGLLRWTRAHGSNANRAPRWTRAAPAGSKANRTTGLRLPAGGTRAPGPTPNRAPRWAQTPGLAQRRVGWAGGFLRPAAGDRPGGRPWVAGRVYLISAELLL
jgi:hypothetical protein